ncbi:MAG TPA: hypothetical protein VLK36_03340 [Gaiellaceae bacterium]|nr:hypothetical protein [Gaiellaceae bacterium]
MNPLYKTMIAVAALGVGLFTLSGILRNADSGVTGVLGGIGWFGFWACVLGLIVLALVALGRGVLRRATA